MENNIATEVQEFRMNDVLTGDFAEMEIITCTKCGIDKLIGEFSKCPNKINGVKSACKECHNKAHVEYRRKLPNYIRSMYLTSVSNSKKRGQDLPNYDFEIYKTWLFAKSKFLWLWNDYVESDYEKDLAPSVNRLDSSLPYTLGNLELGTWRENFEHEMMEKLTGKARGNYGRSIVQQLDKDTLEVIEEFHSIAEAVRVVGDIFGSNICKCLKGTRNHTGGYAWRLVEANT